MNIKNLNQKGQSLPLNTIVIAILVIIVLLVIIVFFTSKVGESGETIDDTTNDLRACQTGTLLIPADKYLSATERPAGDRSTCPTGEDRIVGASVQDGQICCAVPRAIVN